MVVITLLGFGIERLLRSVNLVGVSILIISLMESARLLLSLSRLIRRVPRFLLHREPAVVMRMFCELFLGPWSPSEGVGVIRCGFGVRRVGEQSCIF